MLYIVVGEWRVPWGFRVYRGKDTSSPAELGLRRVLSLPKTLTAQFEVLVLADTAFGGNEFVTRVRQFKQHALVGIRCNRKLEDGRSVAQLHKRGQQVRLFGWKFPVHVSWYYFQREDGKWEKRYVICTKALKASTISWWGRRRWQIEGFFTRCQISLWYRPFWSANPIGDVSLVSPILNRLSTSSLGSSPFRRERFTGLG